MKLFLSFLLLLGDFAHSADTTYVKYVDGVSSTAVLTGTSSNTAIQGPATVTISGAAYTGSAKEYVVIGLLNFGNTSINLDADYGATSNGPLANDASNVNVFANVLGTTIVSVNGRSGSSGLSASVVCANKIIAGDYEVTPTPTVAPFSPRQMFLSRCSDGSTVSPTSSCASNKQRTKCDDTDVQSILDFSKILMTKTKASGGTYFSNVCSVADGFTYLPSQDGVTIPTLAADPLVTSVVDAGMTVTLKSPQSLRRCVRQSQYTAKRMCKKITTTTIASRGPQYIKAWDNSVASYLGACESAAPSGTYTFEADVIQYDLLIAGASKYITVYGADNKFVESSQTRHQDSQRFKALTDVTPKAWSLGRACEQAAYYWEPTGSNRKCHALGGLASSFGSITSNATNWDVYPGAYKVWYGGNGSTASATVSGTSGSTSDGTNVFGGAAIQLTLTHFQYVSLLSTCPTDWTDVGWGYTTPAIPASTIYVPSSKSCPVYTAAANTQLVEPYADQGLTTNHGLTGTATFLTNGVNYVATDGTITTITDANIDMTASGYTNGTTFTLQSSTTSGNCSIASCYVGGQSVKASLSARAVVDYTSEVGGGYKGSINGLYNIFAWKMGTATLNDSTGKNGDNGLDDLTKNKSILKNCAKVSNDGTSSPSVIFEQVTWSPFSFSPSRTSYSNSTTKVGESNVYLGMDPAAMQILLDCSKLNGGCSEAK